MTRRQNPTLDELRSDERRLSVPSPHGRIRVAIGYPNTYHVAMSSLAHQWVVHLAAQIEGVGVERFFAEPSFAGSTFEQGNPLGGVDCLAFSCSFELDAVNILKTLDAAGIPRERELRNHRHPLVVVGGAVASINPLPLAPAVDVFCLGAAELLLPILLTRLRETPDRERLLEDLAQADGFFIPAHHLGADGRPSRRCRRLEKRDRHMADPKLVPASTVVTPHTEYSSRGLVEMSRGCPEKCRYCWVSYNYGRLRSYPKTAIIDRVEEIASITDRIGFIATAVGDHPDLAEILHHCRDIGLQVALSSLRIPAMVPDVLRPLADSGAKSVTIAPETGSEALRFRLSKPMTNERVLEAVRTAQNCGIENLKMYFIVGLPDETDDDVLSIARLLEQAKDIMVSCGRQKGRLGSVHGGVSILVPKPYTPYQQQQMLTAAEAKRRLRFLRAAITKIPNVTLDIPSYREAQWQGFLSRGGIDAYEAIAAVASGMRPSRWIADNTDLVAGSTTEIPAEKPAWSFISSAPARKP